MDLEIVVDDPRRPEVVAVLQRHLRQMHDVTPVEGVFAFAAEALADPTISFFSGRVAGTVVSVGALKHLEDGHVEIKSMHTVSEARGRGFGTAMLTHLLAEAAARGYRRISLETGNMDAFAPARVLYEAAGFVVCPPFGPYIGSTTSTCMTKTL